MQLEGIVNKASEHVCELFERLPPKMYFHNLKHTLMVLDAATLIGLQSGLNVTELEILQLAALFHDTGYLYHYNGHEENSQIIAGNYLMQQGLSFTYIELVINCIGATKVPQQPQNLLQQVMCDADLAHFAAADYVAQTGRLKDGWKVYLGKNYTEKEWAAINLQLLKNHTYFTSYAREHLQPLKKSNIERLEVLIAER